MGQGGQVLGGQAELIPRSWPGVPIPPDPMLILPAFAFGVRSRSEKVAEIHLGLDAVESDRRDDGEGVVFLHL
jgi:hypothetical protein